MKKTIILLAMMEFMLFISHSHATSSAKIKSFEGSVEILESEGQPPKQAKVGMALSSSYIISTGSHSYCVIQLDESNMFRIKQNTSVVIAKIWEESRKLDGKVVSEVRLNLLRGELLAKLNQMPKDSEFNVEGPVAIAGAAGTAYTVSVDYESQNTSVTVLDHEVTVESRNEPNKVIRIQKFESIESAPWQNTVLREIGRGVLSEAILGRKFVQEAEQDIQVQAVGSGSSVEEAKLQALNKLSRIVSQLRVDQKTSLENILAQDQVLTQKLYQAIADAQVLGSIQNPDGSLQAKCQISLIALTQAIGQPLYGITQSVIPFTLLEYSSKFGALARVTTQRAAQVEGYRNLAEMIYGTVINSTTTIEDFAVKDDTVRTTVQGVVKGAQMVGTQYFSDGSIIVSLEMRGDLVPPALSPITGNVYGQNYLSGPQLIEFRNFEDYLELEKSTKL